MNRTMWTFSPYQFCLHFVGHLVFLEAKLTSLPDQPGPRVWAGCLSLLRLYSLAAHRAGMPGLQLGALKEASRVMISLSELHL